MEINLYILTFMHLRLHMLKYQYNSNKSLPHSLCIFIFIIIYIQNLTEINSILQDTNGKDERIYFVFLNGNQIQFIVY